MGLDGGCSLEFRKIFEDEVLARGRVAFSWNYSGWCNEQGDCSDWFYSFRPIPGTPYMIALTVVADEVRSHPTLAPNHRTPPSHPTATDSHTHERYGPP